MMLKEMLTNALEFNLKYAEELVCDIPEELRFETGGRGLENHAGFTLGHLVTALSLTCKYLGEGYDVSEEWDQLFRRKGPGDPTLPESEILKYPASEKIIAELRTKTLKLIKFINAMDEQEFGKQVSWRFNEYFPTMLDLLTFMCIEHSAMHLGQLAAWRRAKGYDSALKKL